MRHLRLAVGGAIWAAAAASLWLAVDRRVAQGTFASRVVPQLVAYSITERREATLACEPGVVVAAGDPIFFADGPGTLRQVGEVRADVFVVPPSGGPQKGEHGQGCQKAGLPTAEALFYASAPILGPRARLTYYTTPDSLNWVVDTLLTPERKAEIAADLSAAWAEHQDEIMAAFRPVIEESLRDAGVAAEAELPAALVRHQPELEALAARYHEEIVERDLAPLAREELWPLLRARAAPTMDEVGREVFARVSFWRFGWRAVVDKTVSPDEPLVVKEWQRFVDQEVDPILERHVDDFVEVVDQTLRDAADNQRVRDALRRSLAQVIADPEFRAIVQRIAREVLLENPRVQQALRERWTGPEAQSALRLAAQRLEPTIRGAADRVLGTREGGITPEFALVLRTQILAKDRRWLLLEDPGGPPAPALGSLVLYVRSGGVAEGNPFLPAHAASRPAPGQ